MTTEYQNERGEWVPKYPKSTKGSKGSRMNAAPFGGSGRDITSGEYSKPVQDALPREELARLVKEYISEKNRRMQPGGPQEGTPSESSMAADRRRASQKERLEREKLEEGGDEAQQI